MACRIKYQKDKHGNDTDQIAEVLAPNGNSSKLFEDIKFYMPFNNDRQALSMYNNIYLIYNGDDKFKGYKTDNNGEIDFNEVDIDKVMNYKDPITTPLNENNNQEAIFDTYGEDDFEPIDISTINSSSDMSSGKFNKRHHKNIDDYINSITNINSDSLFHNSNVYSQSNNEYSDQSIQKLKRLVSAFPLAISLPTTQNLNSKGIDSTYVNSKDSQAYLLYDEDKDSFQMSFLLPNSEEEVEIYLSDKQTANIVFNDLDTLDRASSSYKENIDENTNLYLEEDLVNSESIDVVSFPLTDEDESNHLDDQILYGHEHSNDSVHNTLSKLANDLLSDKAKKDENFDHRTFVSDLEKVVKLSLVLDSSDNPVRSRISTDGVLTEDTDNQQLSSYYNELGFIDLAPDKTYNSQKEIIEEFLNKYKNVLKDSSFPSVNYIEEYNSSSDNTIDNTTDDNIDSEFEEPSPQFPAYQSGVFTINTDPTDKQQAILDKVATNESLMRDNVEIDPNELSGDGKRLAAFRNIVIRKQAYNPKTGKVEILDNRPSDFGTIIFAEKQLRRQGITKQTLIDIDNRKESMIYRGMGTTLHLLAENLMNQVVRLNENNEIIEPGQSVNRNTFIKDSKSIFYDLFKTSTPEQGGLLYDVAVSLGNTGKYTHKLDRSAVVDSSYEGEVPTEFTIDSRDLDNLLELVLGLYADAINTQAAIDRDSNIKHKPIVLQEVPVLNFEDSIGGSIDLLFVFSDGTVSQYDYKFMSLEKEMQLVDDLDESRLIRQKSEKYYMGGQLGEIPNTTKSGLEYIDGAIAAKMRLKKEGYNGQASTYKNLMRDNFNLERDEIRHSRVIPANVVYKKETYVNEKGKTRLDRKKILPEVHFVDTSSEILKPIPLARELTDDADLNKFIDKLFAQIKIIKTKLKTDRNNENLLNSLATLEKNIEYLQLEKNVFAVAKSVNDIISNFAELINEPLFMQLDVNSGSGILLDNGIRISLNPKAMSDKEMMDYEDILLLYSNLHIASRNRVRQLFEEEKDEQAKRLEEITIEQQDQINVLLRKIKETRDDRIMKSVDYGYVITDDGTMMSISMALDDMKGSGIHRSHKYSMYKDVTNVSYLLNAMSDFNHPHVRLFKELLDTMNVEVKVYVDTVAEHIEKASKKLREFGAANGKKGLEVYDYLINKSGHLVTKYSSAFYEALEEARTNKDIDWLKENLTFDEDKFNTARARHEQLMERLYGEDSPIVTKKMIDFDNKYDMNSSNYAYYQTDRVFWKVTNEEPWINERWQFIQDNEALKEFYDLHINIVKQASNQVGDSVFIKENFVANIQKDTLDSFIQNGVFNYKGLKDIVDNYINSFKIRQNDEDLGVTVDGKAMEIIPLKFIDSVPGGIKNKSRDLAKSLLIFAYTAKQYEASKNIEGISNALRRSLANTHLMKINKKSEIVPDEYVSAADSNVYMFLDKAIKNYIYGQTLQDMDQDINGLSRNKIAQALISFFSRKNLAFNSLSIVGGHIGAMMQLRQLIRKGKYFNSKQHIEAEKEWTRLSPMAAIMDHIFEVSQEGNPGLIYEKANKVSASRLREIYNKPLSYIGQRKSDDGIDRTILYAMLKSHVLHPNGKDVVHQSEIEDRIGSEGKDLPTMWETFEKILKENINDQDSNGNNDSVFKEELFKSISENQFVKFRAKVRKVAGIAKGNQSAEDLSVYKLSLLGRAIMQYRGWLPAMAYERWQNPKYDYTLEEVRIGRYQVIIGEVIKEGFIPSVKKFTTLALSLGLDALTFNKLNLTKASITQSQKYFDKWRKQNPGDYKNLLRKYKNYKDSNGNVNPEMGAFKDWYKERSGQLRAAAAEIRTYAILLAGMLAIGFAAGDDERRRSPLIKTIIEHLDRASLEVGFFFIPTEFMQIVTRSPIPVLSLVSDTTKLLSNTVGETKDILLGAEKNKLIQLVGVGDDAFSLEYLQQKPDRSKPFMYTFKMIPALKGVTDFLDFESSGKNDKNDTFMEWLFDSNDSAFYK